MLDFNFNANELTPSSAFLPFVREKEPFILTYAIFTRPKAPKEVLLFVRYEDADGMKSHSRAPEHVAVV